MKANRLDDVLLRNRKHLVLDLALAAFFLLALLFSAIAFGSLLPDLAPGRVRAAAVKQKVAEVSMVMASASESSPAPSVR